MLKRGRKVAQLAGVIPMAGDMATSHHVQKAVIAQVIVQIRRHAKTLRSLEQAGSVVKQAVLTSAAFDMSQLTHHRSRLAQAHSGAVLNGKAAHCAPESGVTRLR
jgi:hypothetical protein